MTWSPCTQGSKEAKGKCKPGALAALDALVRKGQVAESQLLNALCALAGKGHKENDVFLHLH